MEILASLVILSLIVAAYWSLVVMPKQQAFRRHQRYVQEIRVGDQVVTYGGLIAEITAIEPELGEATIRLAENLEVRIITAAITQPYNPEALTSSIQAAGVDRPADGR